MGKGKKKGNKPNDQERSSNQNESTSKQKLEEQQKNQEEKVQQQQDKQQEQLISAQSNERAEEPTKQDPENSSQHLTQQLSPPNPPPSQMEPSKQTGKGKQKDWTCPKCNRFNFAKKTSCKDCNEPKPVPVEQPPIETVPEPSTSKSMALPLVPLPICDVETSSDPKKLYEGTKGRKCRVEVNYLELNLKSLCKICYHYDVSFVPETPKKMFSAALEQFMSKFFKGCFYGFDGRKIMITNKKLSFKNSDFDEFTEKVEAHFGDRKRDFEIKIKFVAADDMEALKNYKNNEKPVKANQHLDIILKSVFRQQIDKGLAVRAGRNLYFVPQGRKDFLGDGMELWYGLFQAAILGRAKVYLNVDVLHKAVPSAVHLLDYIKVYDRSSPKRIPQELSDENKKNLNYFLKGLTIGYSLNSVDPPKTYSFNGLGDSASRATFECNGKKISVKDYFEKEKKIKMQYPNLPVLWVGSKTKNIFLPLEFCELASGQVTNKTCSTNVVRNLIKLSATSPNERKQKIRGLLDMIPYNIDSTIKGFGIEVGQAFQTVEARVIDLPNVKYENENVRPYMGGWNAGTFLEVERNLVKWCILNGSPNVNAFQLNNLKNDLILEAKKQNIFMEGLRTSDMINMKLAGNKINVEKRFAELKNSGYQLVIIILSSDKDYQVVKNTSELCVGILTSCIKQETIQKKMGGNNATVKNILLKLNAKLNGKNHEIEESSFKVITKDAGVMFVGADVTHPSPDQKNIPSVVGVVSSKDQLGTKYTPDWRLQKPGEMIQDLENILVDHIKGYKKFNGKLPKRIMYYRDGVSDGEFKKVLDIEMTAIKKALTRMYEPNKPAEVTFIVVQKRHHTRLFPTDSKFADKKGNILPGTVVDKDIVHPFQFQFFMASHTSLQGVTKPSKYCILVNESKISADDIQAITFDLCHLFVRCTRSVSYPAPTYYAHLVAARGKNYFDENDIASIMMDIDHANKQYQNNGINKKFVSESPMFFV